MIRRQISANGYLLISQIQHARLAGEIAEIWNSSELENYPFVSDLRYAIRHHDDGWKEWEASPDLEPSLHLPRTFTEMETHISLNIARQCIRKCATYSEVCGYWVSHHFQYLAQQKRRSTGLTQRSTEQIDQFLDEQQIAVEQGKLNSSRQILMKGTAWLRFFDRISLLLCCRLPAKPDLTESPDGRHVTIEQHVSANGIIVVATPGNLKNSAKIATPCQEYHSHKHTRWPDETLPEKDLIFELG